MTQIATYFDTPVVSVDRFCELSGMTKATVQRRIEEGRTPVMPKQGKREMVMVEHLKEHVAPRKPDPRLRRPQA